MNYSQKGSNRFQNGSSEAHTKLIIDTLVYLGVHARGLCRVWRNECGMGLNIRTQTPFKYGLEGSADILGIVNTGKLLCLEAKTGNAKQSQGQKNFEQMVKDFNGHYFVIRSQEEALDFVKRITNV